METLLFQTLSSDDRVRHHATHELKRIERDNYSNYAKNICGILASKELEDSIRLSAGLALKNSLSSDRSQFGWRYTNQLTRNEIKSKIVSLLDTDKRNVANVVSQVLATIASIELPERQWDHLIHILLSNVTSSHTSSHLRQSTLITIGYICEIIEPNILSTSQCNDILTAIIQGARREEPDVGIRHAAINALYNSLEFIRNNFENKTERDYIMKVVCDGATQHINSTIELQISSYECLNRIMQLYYHKMEDYMSSLLSNLTIYSMIRSEPKITSQAIEFWCTVCNIEIETNNTSFSFANQWVTYIIPSLFQLLIKHHDEEYDENSDDDNQAAECLSLFALCTKEMVVPQTIEFISHNLLVSSHQKLTWNQKEAAIVAFGSIIEGPCKYKTIPLVNQIIPILLASMTDTTNTYVPIAASRTLSLIIKQSIQVLDVPPVLDEIIPVISKGLYSEHQKIVYNSCLCLIYLSQELKPIHPTIDNEATVTISDTGPLSILTEKIIFDLFAITSSTDTHYDIKCRGTIYETISSIISHCSKDCHDSVKYVTLSVMDRLEKLNQLARKKEYQHNDDFWNLQTSLLGVLSNCIYRLGHEVTEYSDNIMALVYRINEFYLQHDNNINGLNSTVVEDAFLLVSALINTTAKKFNRYIDHFLPDLSQVLTRQLEHESSKTADYTSTHLFEAETRLSLISVGIMSDISNTFGEAIFPYAGEFMKLLVNNLKSKKLHGDVKPVTLSCIGDIAQALGPVFVPYLETVMMVLKQAGNMQADKENQDMIAYVDSIRIGTLEAFIGITLGLCQNAATKEILFPYVTDFVFYLNSIVMDKNRSDRLTRTMIGLLGDIARIYGKRIKYSLIETPLNQLMIENLKGELYFSRDTKEMANWAQQTLMAVYHKK